MLYPLIAAFVIKGWRIFGPHLPSTARAPTLPAWPRTSACARFDPHSYRPLQPRVKGSRLSRLVLQTPLHFLARLGIQHGDLLVACMQITPYNHHRSAPFLRALVA